MSYNRYKYLKTDDGRKITNIPPVSIKERNTDVYRLYNSDKTRLDRISAEVYASDEYGWLILMANPEYAMEFDIPKETVLRIPYPLREVLTEFESKVIKNRNIS